MRTGDFVRGLQILATLLTHKWLPQKSHRDVSNFTLRQAMFAWNTRVTCIGRNVVYSQVALFVET